MIKSVSTLNNLSGKKVLVRVDFNVPFKNGIINDDNRIRAALKTINHLLDLDARVILFSHLGKVNHKDPTKTESDKIKNNMEIVYHALKELLSVNVYFVNKVLGEEVVDAVNRLNDKEVLLLQNTRYEAEEEKNGEHLSNFFASLADIYVMDAFGSAHRAHASTVGAPEIMKKNGKTVCCGYLVETEVKALEKCVNPTSKPYIAVLGGVKVSDKIKVIDALLRKCDKILIGGAMSYTFQKALGVSIGKSLCEDDMLDYAKKCFNSGKIILPIDVVVASSIEDSTGKEVLVNDIPSDLQGVDIGCETAKLFAKEITNAKIVFMNGPMGVFENDAFSHGTKAILEALASSKSYSVIGGGDSASATKKFNFDAHAFGHISTGGGASLELIENDGYLPGIAVLEV